MPDGRGPAILHVLLTESPKVENQMASSDYCRRKGEAVMGDLEYHGRLSRHAGETYYLTKKTSESLYSISGDFTSPVTHLPEQRSRTAC
jgi:hypothetical protein